MSTNQGTSRVAAYHHQTLEEAGSTLLSGSRPPTTPRSLASSLQNCRTRLTFLLSPQFVVLCCGGLQWPDFLHVQVWSRQARCFPGSGLEMKSFGLGSGPQAASHSGPALLAWSLLT